MHRESTATPPRPHHLTTLFLSLLAALISCTAMAAEPCAPPADGEPMFITDECVDPRFNQPYVDIDEWRDTPVRHRYVHGGFTGTDARFAFYFPPPERYRGRFFQYTHQLLNSEETEPVNIGFGVDSGAYFVQTNLGGVERATTPEQALDGSRDPAVGGYRVNAAAAKYSKQVAAQMYGKRHRQQTFGYLFGGSGGAFQTIAAAQNSRGVWHGYVPFVMGSPNAIPGVFTARIHALRVLRQRGKFPEILDAIDPGGSGDPYATLDDEERGALEEVTRLGFPPRGWWDHATMTGGPLRLVAGYVPLLDPGYFDDFWSLPGYLGTDPLSSVQAARVQHPTAVVATTPLPPFPGGVVVANLPLADLSGADLIVDSGAAAGTRLPLFGAVSANVVALQFGADAALLAGLQPGDQVRIDNSDYLALQTYHRHQLPTTDMYGWNFLRHADGTPRYPQREVLVGPIGAFNGAGSMQSGHFHGKMIAVGNLMDIDAFPWQTDWYRSKVKAAKGSVGLVRDFRLWFIDHAQHTSPAPTNTAAFARTVSYRGVLEQALRDVSDWVEKGRPAPASTRYHVDGNSQVRVPPVALLRKGIQPVVELRANGAERAEVRVGQKVLFSGIAALPPATGEIVEVEWDFLGSGDFPPSAASGKRGYKGKLGHKVLLRQQHIFTEPGTYFPVVRITSQRQGDAGTPYARIQNIDRVRVVVSARK